MIRHFFCAAALLALAACAASAPEPSPSPAPTETLAVSPAPEVASPPVTPPPRSPPPPSPPRPPGSHDPDVVLRAWGDAIEARDWVMVRRFWGDQGARSGLSEADFAARWTGLHYPRVSLGKGTSEGAAGSLYYTAPITITDGSRAIAGEVVLRRANDVDGASAEQLRWHIERTTLKP